MNINQALKEKARIVRHLDGLYRILSEYNSIESGNPRHYSITDTIDEIGRVTLDLVELKTKIHKANVPVYDKIFNLSELKSGIKKLKEMPVTEGKKLSMYGSSVENLEVEVNAHERDSIVLNMQRDIDKLQDELDVHNATTYI